MTPPAVTVVVDGRIVAGSERAELRAGIVTAPLEPYVAAIAMSVLTSADGRRVELRGGGRVVVVVVAAAKALDRFSRPQAYPLAPLARALGAAARYDAAARTLVVTTAAPSALATPTPFDASSPPGPPAVAGTPAAPTPRPTVTGVPRPRRTPIVFGGGGGESSAPP